MKTPCPCCELAPNQGGAECPACLRAELDRVLAQINAPTLQAFLMAYAVATDFGGEDSLDALCTTEAAWHAAGRPGLRAAK